MCQIKNFVWFKDEAFTIAFDLGGVVFSCDNDIFSDKYLETELTRLHSSDSQIDRHKQGVSEQCRQGRW